MAIVKLLHVLFVFCWIGSLLVLTRMMARRPDEPPEIQLGIGRAYRRLYISFELPSMILAVCFGLILLFYNGVNWKAPWLHMKLTFAFFLIASDIAAGMLAHGLSQKEVKSRAWYKIFHIIIAVLFIAVLVSIYILKPKFISAT